MRPRTAYLVLCIAGTLIPLTVFIPWVQTHGLDLRLMVSELFASRIGAFFGLDVIVSACVVVVATFVERVRRPRRLWWAPILATLVVGVSCGLPLLLYLSESDRPSVRAAVM